MLWTYVDDVCLVLSNDLVVPLPDLGCDWLTNRAQYTESLHLVLHVVVTCALQESQSGRCNVELRHSVLLAHVPVSAEIGVCWCTLKDNSRNTQNQRCVDDIGVSCDPTHITSAEEYIRVVDIKDVLSSSGSTQQIPGSCVHHTLRLAR